jgi:hypothetical protein
VGLELFWRISAAAKTQSAKIVGGLLGHLRWGVTRLRRLHCTIIVARLLLLLLRLRWLLLLLLRGAQSRRIDETRQFSGLQVESKSERGAN